jgi:RNA polymerase sigma-70 factor (ECF subfamily)
MELLDRFAAGDLEAFEALFRQHPREVYAWIVRIVRDSGIAEDLTVETFWRIYRTRSRFDPAGNFPSASLARYSPFSCFRLALLSRQPSELSYPSICRSCRSPLRSP